MRLISSPIVGALTTLPFTMTDMAYLLKGWEPPPRRGLHGGGAGLDHITDSTSAGLD